MSGFYDLLGEDDSSSGVATGKAPVPAKKEEKVVKASAAPAKKEEPKFVRKPDSDNKGEARGPRPQGERERRPRQERSDDSAVSGSPRQDRPPRESRPPRTDRPEGQRRERVQRDAADTGAAGAHRVYDRRSGTGRGREEKRGGAGRANWGTATDEVNAPAQDNNEAVANEATEDAAEETTTVAAEPVPQRELTAEELARIAEREKEDKQMTLDEYLKTKKGPVHALPEARKAGEGEDAAQWGKFVAAKSDKLAVEEPKEAVKKVEEKKPKQQPVDAALLRFKSEAAARRDAERRESRNRRDDRDDRPDRPERPRPAPKAAAPAPRPVQKAFALDVDFPALKA